VTNEFNKIWDILFSGAILRVYVLAFSLPFR